MEESSKVVPSPADPAGFKMKARNRGQGTCMVEGLNRRAAEQSWHERQSVL